MNTPTMLSLEAMPPDVRRALACRIDRATFSRIAGITPDPWQARLLRSNHPRILVNCSRQSGKSTTMGTLALHQALYEPGSLTLIVSPTQRQSGELFRKMLDVYRRLGKSITVNAESDTALTLELANRSRIVALPGKEGTIRSYSAVSLLLLDEAAKIANELYLSVRPMLAVSQGRMIAASTPFGKRGWWYEAWRGAHDGTQDWDYYFVTANECPRITAEFLADEKRDIGDWWFAQEYEGAFLDAESSAFRDADIQAALSDEVELWDV
ncbi:MAG TPA: phage terminase large subunit [Ktedonobacterales bacterium]|nr:phage terminase large subunit [Ktedonobacterales bacterium]